MHGRALCLGAQTREFQRLRPVAAAGLEPQHVGDQAVGSDADVERLHRQHLQRGDVAGGQSRLEADVPAAAVSRDGDVVATDAGEAANCGLQARGAEFGGGNRCAACRTINEREVAGGAAQGDLLRLRSGSTGGALRQARVGRCLRRDDTGHGRDFLADRRAAEVDAVFAAGAVEHDGNPGASRVQADTGGGRGGFESGLDCRGVSSEIEGRRGVGASTRSLTRGKGAERCCRRQCRRHHPRHLRHALAKGSAAKSDAPFAQRGVEADRDGGAGVGG